MDTCWDETGLNISNTWSPCDFKLSNDSYSTCCPKNLTCKLNLSCSSEPGLRNYHGNLIKAACTDRTYQSKSCPRYCDDGNRILYNGIIRNCNNGIGCCENLHTSDCACSYGDIGAVLIGSSEAPDQIISLGYSYYYNPSTASLSPTASATYTAQSSKPHDEFMIGIPIGTVLGAIVVFLVLLCCLIIRTKRPAVRLSEQMPASQPAISMLPLSRQSSLSLRLPERVPMIEPATSEEPPPVYEAPPVYAP